MVSPPGVNAAAFADASSAMRSIVGAHSVFDAPEDLNTYRDFYSCCGASLRRSWRPRRLRPPMSSRFRRSCGWPASGASCFTRSRRAFNFYGPEAISRAQWEHSRDRFAATIPGATFREDEFVRLPLSDEALERVFKARFGIPKLERFSLGSSGSGPLAPSDGHIWISAVIPRTGEGIVQGARVMLEECKRLEIPVLAFSPRSPAGQGRR